MATITLTQLLQDSDDWYGNALKASSVSAITTQTSTKIVVQTDTGLTATITGTGFEYDGPNGAPSAGDITSIKITKGGATWMTLTDLKVELPDAFQALFGWSGTNGNQNNGDSFQVFTVLGSGDDSIIGTDGNDDIFAGRNTGDDTIKAKGGNDFVKASAGNNSMDGGAGDYDILTFEETFWDMTAYRGVSLNLATGKATNAWGGTDTIKNFEQVFGSRLSDKLTGDVGDNTIAGLRGVDSINGGDGFDAADYSRDGQWGGTKGIVANLASGTIVDGFGSKDSVTSIEAVMGTDAADKFVGSDEDNQFFGGRGKDSFSGGGGNDEVVFWRNDNSSVGVVVDLSLTSSQIQNDGYGNKESTTSIEDLSGGNQDDNFTGSDVKNLLWGNGGDDTLSGEGGSDILNGQADKDNMTGGSGADRFQYEYVEDSESGASKRDVITDFKVGTDKIDLSRIQDADWGTSGNQDFVFIGDAAITGRGQVRFDFAGDTTSTTSDDRTIISVNVDGSIGAEMQIELIGFKNLTADDFLLV